MTHSTRPLSATGYGSLSYDRNGASFLARSSTRRTDTSRELLSIAREPIIMIGSRAIDNNSRLVSVRRVEDRAKKLAPFLSYDNDPYPVALNGRVLWVIDAYTTSDRYPYGESGDRSQLNAGSGLDHPFNYVRNSVKVVVDAYNGNVDFYIVDPVDPVVRVW